MEGANLPETADAFRGVRTADDRSEGERTVGLPGAAADHSLAFKGCTLSQYTSAYDSRGSEVSQAVTVGRSASRGLQTTRLTPPPPPPPLFAPCSQGNAPSKVPLTVDFTLK